MPRSVALSLVFILAACDSAEPSLSREDLVGSWTPAQDVKRVWVTSSRTQEILDPSQPASGDLRISGARSERLRFVSGWRASRDHISYTISSNPFLLHPFPDDRSFLSLNEYRLDATVWRGEDYTHYGLDHTVPPYALRDQRLTFDDVTLSSVDGSTVTVDGSLTFPMRTVRADNETLIEERIRTVGPGDLLTRVVFESDGTYRKERDTDSGVRILLPGTWELLDETRVRLHLTTQEGIRTDEVTVERDGDTLTLSSFGDVCPDSQPSCLGYHEDQFVLARGSLTRVRDENRTVYRPTQ